MGLKLRGNTWFSRWEVNGKEHVRSCKTSDKALALEVAEAHLRELKGISAPPGEMPVLTEALKRVYEEHWSKTRDGELPVSRLIYVSESCGDVPLSAIDSSYVNCLRNTLRKEGKAPATINRYMAALRFLMRYAQSEWGLDLRLPAFRQEKEPTGRTTVVSRETEARLVEYFEGRGLPHFADLLQILADTGMRLGEALRMNYRENIDLEAKVIRLEAEATKSAKPRLVPMTSRVHSILANRKDGDRPFEGIERWNVRDALNVAKAALEIKDKDLVTHAFRHTCASRLIEKGIDLYTVSKVLGHANITVTERYSHLQLAAVEKAIAVLEE